MKIIRVYCGTEILVDDSDYEWLKNYRWFIRGETDWPYAATWVKGEDGEWKLINMHHMIMNTKKMIDHADRNTKNNQRNNLRLCTPSQNGGNSRKANTRIFTSQYKGVYFSKKHNTWQSTIVYHGQHIHLGVFSNEIAAANMYNHAATRLFCEFAKINDVVVMNESECNEYLTKIRSSSYYGVTCRKRDQRWYAQISDPATKKSRHIGTYLTELEAAIAYNDCAIELYGENYKRLNIIPETEG